MFDDLCPDLQAQITVESREFREEADANRSVCAADKAIEFDDLLQAAHPDYAAVAYAERVLGKAVAIIRKQEEMAAIDEDGINAEVVYSANYHWLVSKCCFAEDKRRKMGQMLFANHAIGKTP